MRRVSQSIPHSTTETFDKAEFINNSDFKVNLRKVDLNRHRD
jgi:hypothetical protein